MNRNEIFVDDFARAWPAAPGEVRASTQRKAYRLAIGQRRPPMRLQTHHPIAVKRPLAYNDNRLNSRSGIERMTSMITHQNHGR